MRGRLANTVRLRVAAETQPLIRLRAGPQTPSPKGEGVLPKNFHHPYKTVTARTPCTYCGHTACAGGFCMLEQLSLFFLGGGAYAALELAWRGTTHWTMFAAGGACLCLLQSWLLHRCRWPGPPPWAQPASAGWSWRWGQSAAACCTPRCGTIPPSGGMWPGLSARGTPFTGFCSAGGSSLCCGA